MLTLVVVGLLGGLITSLSPCVLPVLPVVLSVGVSTPAEGLPTKARPYGVIAGLVLSFSLATLFGSVALSALGLPQDLLRDTGIAVLLVLGVGLVVPWVGHLLERPFAKLPSRAVSAGSSGVGLGLALGVLYVPCAGPVLATIAVVGANHRVGLQAVVLTVAFAVGAGLPLLVLAAAGERLTQRVAAVRGRTQRLRVASGLVMVLVAFALLLNVTDVLQRHVPGYTEALQSRVEGSASVTHRLQSLTGEHSLVQPTTSTKPAPTTTPAGSTAVPDVPCTEGGAVLENCGHAPELAGITGWLNTPGDKPLSIAGLRGKVVLLDFWTYSCINCQRTLPHVEAWYKAYQSAGLVVLGVHTPEFSFEHVRSNISSNAARLGVTYPIAIDNDYATWNAWGNQYWPAEYLVDAQGVVRHVTFGEGDYAGTEALIRQLLMQAKTVAALPLSTHVASAVVSPNQTPESYIGYKEGQSDYSGRAPVHDKATVYAMPAKVEDNTFALSGEWTDHAEEATAGKDARLDLNYFAAKVFLVLGGSGSVTVQDGDGPSHVVQVRDAPTLYTLVDDATPKGALLHLSFSPGVQAYSFTFG